MKIKIQFLALLLFFSGLAVTANAKENAVSQKQMEERVIQIKDRVNEIKSLNFSHLNREQRVSLRAELKNDKIELRHMQPYGYVYISAGALILIIVLLIILL